MNRQEQLWAYRSLFLLLSYILGVLLNLDNNHETIMSFAHLRDMHETFMKKAEENE